MAKNTNPTGVYAPPNYRARRLIRQLRMATHRTVQNALIQELIHELQKGSRRAKRQATMWGTQVKKHMKRQTVRAGGTMRRKAADVAHRLRFGPRLHCMSCDREFRNKLQFNAHARAHQREQRPLPGRPGRKSPAKAYRAPSRASAKAHARDTLAAAGPRGKAAQAAGRTAVASGAPLGARDLKAMAKQARTAPPPARSARADAARTHANRRPMDPRSLQEARAKVQTPQSKAESRERAIARRTLRQMPPGTFPGRKVQASRTPRAAPALKLAPVTPARAPKAPTREFSYDTPAGPITSDRPLSPQQVAGLGKEIRHARELRAQGKAGPGDTVKTTRTNGQRTSSEVVKAPAKAPPARPGRGSS